MRRLAAIVLITGIMAVVPVLRAQEKSATETSETSGEGGGMIAWKWANFAMLVGGLGYLTVKFGGPFFAARSRQIRQEMVDAYELRKEAEARAGEVDRRLAQLDAEIAALRKEAQQEAEHEAQQIARQTETDIAKIRAHSEQEIASAGKAARIELKRYSAQLAIALAEQKIRARMNPEIEDNLVRGFVRGMEHPASKAQHT